MNLKNSYLPIMGPKPKKREQEDPFRKNTHKRMDYNCINCPTCDEVVTYKESLESKTIVCPYCKNFFVPSINMRPRVIPFWIQQAPADWMEI
jgi:uncharacterized CHY-type Zn-finger protein